MIELFIEVLAIILYLVEWRNSKCFSRYERKREKNGGKNWIFFYIFDSLSGKTQFLDPDVTLFLYGESNATTLPLRAYQNLKPFTRYEHTKNLKFSQKNEKIEFVAKNTLRDISKISELFYKTRRHVFIICDLFQGLNSG